MTDGRNRQLLLRGSGREQCARAAKEQTGELLLRHALQKVSAQHYAAASAAGAAGMNILGVRIEN